MTNKLLSIAFFIAAFIIADKPALFAQSDSLSVNLELGLRGRWQTGNLNQFAINPTASLKLSKTTFDLELNSQYQFLKVSGFTAIKDFWNIGIYRHRPGRKIYPMLATNLGFAKSYKIDHSYLAGGGVGLNLYRKSPIKYIRINVFAAYLDLAFATEIPHSSFAVGSNLKGSFPLVKGMIFNWELHSFLSGTDTEYLGVNNLLQLHYKVSKSLFLTLSHNMIYNKKQIPDIEKVNTLMLFGIQYQIHNN